MAAVSAPNAAAKKTVVFSDSAVMLFWLDVGLSPVAIADLEEVAACGMVPTEFGIADMRPSMNPEWQVYERRTSVLSAAQRRSAGIALGQVDVFDTARSQISPKVHALNYRQLLRKSRIKSSSSILKTK